MDQRSKFLDEWFGREGMSRSALCELFGISRQTGYKWARRWRKQRSHEEESRRPKRSPNATPMKLVKLILSQRRQFPLWGPVPILKRLQTIWPQHNWHLLSSRIKMMMPAP